MNNENIYASPKTEAKEQSSQIEKGFDTLGLSTKIFLCIVLLLNFVVAVLGFISIFNGSNEFGFVLFLVNATLAITIFKAASNRQLRSLTVITACQLVPALNFGAFVCSIVLLILLYAESKKYKYVQ